jgi:hypothetical protein
MIIVLILFFISGSVNAAFHDAPSDSFLGLLAEQAQQCSYLPVQQLESSEDVVRKILEQLAQQRSIERADDRKKRAVTFAVQKVGNKGKKKPGKSRATGTVNQLDLPPYRVPTISRLAALKAIDAMKASREQERQIQKHLENLS